MRETRTSGSVGGRGRSRPWPTRQKSTAQSGVTSRDGTTSGHVLAFACERQFNPPPLCR
jgi:hypothetical protein